MKSPPAIRREMQKGPVRVNALSNARVTKTATFILMALVALFLSMNVCDAQTATNAVDNIVDNVEYARLNVVPIALAAMALFVGLAALLKYWKKVFKG